MVLLGEVEMLTSLTGQVVIAFCTTRNTAVAPVALIEFVVAVSSVWVLEFVSALSMKLIAPEPPPAPAPSNGSNC
jgi:hypothetical protein